MLMCCSLLKSPCTKGNLLVVHKGVNFSLPFNLHENDFRSSSAITKVKYLDLYSEGPKEPLYIGDKIGAQIDFLNLTTNCMSLAAIIKIVCSQWRLVRTEWIRYGWNWI